MDAAPSQVATSGAGPAGPRAPERPGRRNATGRRLFLSVSALALAFVLALLFQVWRLHRLEETLEELRVIEDQTRLAFELQDAVRRQYAHQAHFVVGEDAHMAGQRDARARATQIVQALSHNLRDGEALRWLDELEAASDALDREFMDAIVPAVLARDPAAMLLHDKSYAQVAVVQAGADRIFDRLQDAAYRLRAQVAALERATFRGTMIFLALAPVFAGAVALYIGRSVARPLARLGDGAARVASGDLDARIEIDTPDEFGTLAAEFNAMTAALKENQRKLVEGEKLAGIGRLAAGVAHEIANPLAVVLGYVVLHRRTATGRLARDLDVAEQEILRCKDIVQELLDLARPSAGPALTPVDVRALCDEVVETLRSSGNLEVADVAVEGAGVALAPACRLRQVAVNLLKNAADAAGAGGRIRAAVATAGPWIELSVADDGPGIGPEARARLFEPFFTTKPDGTGLGLAVSRSIARANGGDLEFVPSERGAMFVVRLPAAAPREDSP